MINSLASILNRATIQLLTGRSIEANSESVFMRETVSRSTKWHSFYCRKINPMYDMAGELTTSS